MSWNSIVSQTMFEAPTVAATCSIRSSVTGHDRDVGLDRRERVVRGLGARLAERVEQRGLARVGHPDEADLHHRPEAPDQRAERRAGGDVGRVVHAEVEAAESPIAAAATCSGGPGTSAPNARAAANDEVACEEGKESPVGVAIRCGRSSIAGRLRPTASLIDVDVA